MLKRVYLDGMREEMMVSCEEREHMYYKDQLISLRESLNDRLLDLNSELEILPDGKLYVYQKNGKYYYSQRIPKGGYRKKEHRIAITKDSETVLALVRKTFVEKAVQNIQNNILELDRVIENYCPVSEELVMQSFCARYPELAKGIYYGGSDPDAWAADYIQPRFYEDDYKSVSAQGEDVRSGGEMYIMSRLDHFGIPYRYEDDTGIPDLQYAPDLKILRPRDRKIIYWEHFGKVTDYGYVLDNIGKVKDYISYGIKPWNNLIMTFSNEEGGYDGKLIDALIECWLL